LLMKHRYHFILEKSSFMTPKKFTIRVVLKKTQTHSKDLPVYKT
jgi:hypothetical protein